MTAAASSISGRVARPAMLRELIWKGLRNARAWDDAGALRRILPRGKMVEQAELERLLAEATDSEELQQTLRSPEARRWVEHLTANSKWTVDEALERYISIKTSRRARVLFLYVWTRLMRPHVVVETGCLSGWDSAVILAALHKNGEGELHTVDLPESPTRYRQSGSPEGLLEGLKPGFMVPDAFRDRWSLILGEAQEEVPPLLRRLGQIDLFFHDSDHSYTHMMWEYTTALPYVSERGVIASDDISYNTSFWDFADAHGFQYAIRRGNSNFGALSPNRTGRATVGRS